MSDQNDNRTNGAGTPWTPAPPAPPVPPVPPVPPHARRNSGIGAGIVLIVIGVVFLAGQALPGLAWWNMWPLIIVTVGIIQMFTPSHRDEWGPERILDGLGTVAIGCVLLGNTLGIISWGVWWTFITLWPVLIIALGISILGRGLQQSWLRTLAPVLVWAALGYSVALSLTGAGGLQPMPAIVQPVTAGQPFAYMEPVNGAATATLNLKGGAGDIRIHGGSDLVNVSGVTPFGMPEFAVSRSGDSANVDFSLTTEKSTVVIPGVSAARADVALSQTTVWDVLLETGASSTNADFSQVTIRSLALKTGASSASIKLGDVPASAGSTDVSIKAGVSSIEVLVPRDAEVRLDTHNGLTATDVDQRLTGVGGGVWQTPGYSSASKTINVSVESGVSSISVRTY
jgi:hypothetical protein